MLKITKFIERRNNMSFNCVFMNKDFAVLGSDSRESFEDGTYNDNRKKTFWNEEQKLCWSITGLTSVNYIDCFTVINDIMNMKALIIDKLNLIETLMCFLTSQYYKQYNKRIIFDMLIIQHNGEELVLYVLEIINGHSNISVNKQYYQSQNDEVCFASGVHLEARDQISLDKIKQTPIKEMERIVSLAIKSSELTDKTVGGNPKIVFINKYGKIKSY